MTERRAVLTVDLDCEDCGGSGFDQSRTGVDHPCDCVQPREVQVIHDPWHQPEARLREPEEPTHE